MEGTLVINNRTQTYINLCGSKGSPVFKLPRAANAMAVTQQSDRISIEPVKEGADSSGREGTDAGPCGLIQMRKSDGCSTGPRDVKKDDASGKVKGYKPGRNQCKENKSERLSDIDDAEVSRYLNSKEEIRLKRILWEAMNGNCGQAKKQRRTTETKTGISTQKDGKTTKKSEAERRSSKINYDALKMLNDELEQNTEAAETIGTDFYARRIENSPHGHISHRTQGSNTSSYEDDQHDISYGNDDGTFDEGEMYSGYGDDHFSDEYFDF